MRQQFQDWIAFHKACTTWFHAAHHVTKGASFGGDHVNLYGKIYTELETDFDGLVEKALGQTNDESLADPNTILMGAGLKLSEWPQPVNQSSHGIASHGLFLVKDYLRFLDGVYRILEDTNQLSLGVDDFICAASNKYEVYVYLLQQRIKSEL